MKSLISFSKKREIKKNFFILFWNGILIYSSLFIIHYSLFILHFNNCLFFCMTLLFSACQPKVTHSFLRAEPKKRTKRRAADCIFSAKNGSRLPKARKLASCACSNSPRFLTENAPHSLNAPKMRSDLSVFLLILPYFVAYSFLQHRFARLGIS